MQERREKYISSGRINNTMVSLNPGVLVIILNINGLNFSFKRQQFSDSFFKKNKTSHSPICSFKKLNLT